MQKKVGEKDYNLLNFFFIYKKKDNNLLNFFRNTKVFFFTYLNTAMDLLFCRWYTYLNSDFKRGGWSPEEDILLCEVGFTYKLHFLHG